MTKSTFLHEMKERGVAFGDWTLWAKPCVLINYDTGQEIKYKNVEEAYENAVVDGTPLKKIVEESTMDELFGVTLDDSDIMVFKDMFPEDFE